MDEQLEILIAARILEYGGIVAFPTETVYGLGADCENIKALETLYALKQRPKNRPLTVHIVPEADMSFWANDIPLSAYQLMSAFWPGPLTLILKKGKHVLDLVTANSPNVALRCPSHPMALSLLREFKWSRGGVAAPSANLSGQISPTSALHVQQAFAHDERVKMVLDGGDCTVGIESTILDLTQEDIGPIILREGVISAQAISEKIGVMPEIAQFKDSRHHLSLPVEVVLSDEKSLENQLISLLSQNKKVSCISFLTLPDDITKRLIQHRQLNVQAELAIRGFYDALHQLRYDIDVLVMQEPNKAGFQALSARMRALKLASAKK